MPSRIIPEPCGGRRMQSVLGIVMALLVLSACARLPLRSESPHIHQEGPLGECAGWLSSVDTAVKAAGVRDPGPYRIPQYPYLRVDRFLASFKKEVETEERYLAWIAHMRGLDLVARRHELANLSAKERAELFPDIEMGAVMARISQCADLFQREDLSSASQRERLIQKIKVPAEYIPARRVLGIYPFASLFVSHGVDEWHVSARETFSNAPPENWEKQRYSPSENHRHVDPEHILQRATRDRLGIPRFTDQQRLALFDVYAPIWEVQQAGSFDKIGRPYWTADKKLALDPFYPTVYRHLSFARLRSEVLIQLNFIIWFSARPKTSAWDIFGGFLDGVNYRVTLDRRGQPLLFETVHNCGCYHKYYPTARLELDPALRHKEPPLILTTPEYNPAQDRLVISMFSGTHYVNHVYAEKRGKFDSKIDYALEEYDQLRSLPYGTNRRRSMFQEDSIVMGSQRLERWLLWPTGVLSPGAMRQWGRHAVAFVGQRHFDDPYLIQNIFRFAGDENQ